MEERLELEIAEDVEVDATDGMRSSTALMPSAAPLPCLFTSSMREIVSSLGS